MESVNTDGHRTYPRRYALLALLTSTVVIVIFQLQTYVAIADVIVKFYGQSYESVNSLGLIPNVVYLVSFFPIGKFVVKYGLRISMLVATFVNASGAVLKCFSNKTSMFGMLAFGQSLVALSQLTMCGCIPILVSSWFAPEEAPKAFGAFTAAWSSGGVIGFLMPSIVMKITSDSGVTDDTLLWIASVSAIISLSLFVLCWFIFEEKPPTSPSLSEHKRNISDQRYRVIKILRNKNAIIICVCYSLAHGIIQSMAVTLNQSVLSSFHNNEHVLTVAGILLSISGIPASLLTGLSLRKNPKYKLYQLIISTLIAFSCVFYVSSLWMENSALLFISTWLVGFLTVSLFVLLMDYLVEVTYPFPESVSFVILIMASIIPGFAFIPIITKLEMKYGAAKANVLLIPVALLNIILCIFGKEDLRRRQANEETRSNQSEDILINIHNL